MDDVPFLALLVHRGVLSAQDAQSLVPDLRAGGNLDQSLIERLGWDAARVAKLRRTNAGEIPEIPGYEVQASIGTGGTANVFRAREIKTRRTLALKVLKPECTRHDATRKAFVAEGRLLERLDHPGLIKSYGVAKSGATYFSRLAYVDGSTLLELLDGGRDFEESEALQIILEVAEVLQYLEGEGVVHRDIKPGNIMLTRRRGSIGADPAAGPEVAADRRLDGGGRIVLIDLGFAAEGQGSEPTAEDSSVGTVAYLAPEQARGGAAADCRSDIYSLGLSLFHIVVGRLPFESSDDRETLRMQIMQSLSSPELKGRSISPHLHYFIEKMVAKEADHRYQHWAELIEDIRGHIAGRESLDFEKDVRTRASKSIRRSRR